MPTDSQDSRITNPAAFAAGNQEGMRLRDYFAAQVVQGIIANRGWEAGERGYSTVSRIAYLIADAMLAERAK